MALSIFPLSHALIPYLCTFPLFFQDLARWTDSSCRECECLDAQVTCYLRSCPTCPPGTLAITQEGQCCPECRQGMFQQSILCAYVHVCLSPCVTFFCSDKLCFFLHLPLWQHTQHKDSLLLSVGDFDRSEPSAFNTCLLFKGFLCVLTCFFILSYISIQPY